VLGQQVSVAAGRTLAARLVQHVGAAVPGGEEGLTHLFPTPAALAATELAGLGLTRARAATLQALAQGVLARRVDFAAAPAALAAALAAIPGIGPWTAQYVLLRALGEPDALPSADLVLRRVAAAGASALSGRQLDERAQHWQPWRSYAVMHLWQAAGGAGSTRAWRASR
jgi:AraC family transcriptional regulator of adaptative response / DNA-3-methyladenine glycosylase II